MLTNALIAALAATTLVCIGGARMWYLQHICYRRWIQHHKAQDQESKAALEVLQRRFFRLATVIDSYAGGISTRLSESANVVATLHSRNPAFFLGGQTLAVGWMPTTSTCLLCPRHHRTGLIRVTGRKFIAYKSPVNSTSILLASETARCVPQFDLLAKTESWSFMKITDRSASKQTSERSSSISNDGVSLDRTRYSSFETPVGTTIVRW